MRQTLSLITVLLVLLALTSCGTQSLPESSLTIRETTSNLLLSTSQTVGRAELVRGETLQLRVFRTYRTESKNTLTDDVTQFVSFKWEGNPGVASIDQLGNLTGTGVGSALLEVKFRTSSLSPYDICRLLVEVE